jgi:peroxin-16
LPERETDPRAAEADKEAAAGDWNGMDEPIEEPSSSSSSADISWTMPRTGLTLPSLPNANDISSYLISKVLTADDVKAPASLLHRVSGQGQFAEILYILRPVIYALAMQRWSKNKRSWSPWLIGFGLEYGSRQLAKRDLAERAAGGLRGLTGLERDELKKRGWAMGWWMMRGAFYENITRYVVFSILSFVSLTLVRPWIGGIADKLKGKPLLDIVGGLLDDYEYLWDNYYFSTASL